MFYRDIIAVFPDPHKTQKFTVRTEGRILNVKLVLHVVTTGL